MKDRHLLFMFILFAFVGALFFMSEMATNSAVASNRNVRNIPTDLSEDLGITDPVGELVVAADHENSLSMTIEQTDLERMDTLLEKMSEINTLLDEEGESRILIDAVYVK